MDFMIPTVVSFIIRNDLPSDPTVRMNKVNPIFPDIHPNQDHIFQKNASFAEVETHI